MDQTARVAPMSSSPGEITLLLKDLQQGHPEVAEKLMPLVYQQLRQMAAQQFRHERPGHTLQPTALVHEAYLRLIPSGPGPWENRWHFFGVAAQAMRRVLVDHARAHNSGKRGGRRQRVELDEALTFSSERPKDFLALDDALTRLEQFAPRQSRIVELRFFAGLSVRETAQALGVGVTTIKSEWRLARAWLRGQLEGTA